MTLQHAANSIWIYSAAILAIAGFQSWTSRINQFFFFSRTVPAGFAQTSRARQITAHYLRGIWLAFASALFICAGLYASGRLYPIRGLGIALLVQGTCSCVAFARANRETRKALQDALIDQPVNGPTADSAVVSVPLLEPQAFSPNHTTLLFLAPVCALVVAVAALFTAHLGFRQFGEAIDANKATSLLGLGLGMMCASVILYIQLRYLSRHRSPMGRFTANACVLLSWIGALALILSTTSVPLHLVITTQMNRLFLTGIFIFVLARVLYGWSRARLFPPPQVERSGDQFWRLGMFYYNPSDPTLFIQKRSGPGYTLNFAHVMAWPVTLLVAADIVYLFLLHPHN
jgi:hypothetical protein